MENIRLMGVKNQTDKTALGFMKEAKRWLLCDANKIPHYTNGRKRSGELGGQADLANLDTYDNARKVLNENKKFAWLGFALGKDGKDYWQGIRCRISYARNIKKDRRPRRLKNGNIKVSAFFGWAVLQKKWGVLAKVDGLPRDAKVDLEPVPAMVAMTGSVDADDMPTNIQQLQEKYAAEHLARLKAEARVEKLEVENKKLKDQLQSKAERSRRASGYGKEGGRGKKK